MTTLIICGYIMTIGILSLMLSYQIAVLYFHMINFLNLSIVDLSMQKVFSASGVAIC